MKREMTLLEAMDECWFVPAPCGKPRFPPAWDPYKAIAALSRDAFQELVRLRRWRRQNSDRLLTGEMRPSFDSLVSERQHISLNDEAAFASTLLLATLSEYYVDKLLLLPHGLRWRRLREAASLVDTHEEELLAFYIGWWHKHRKILKGKAHLG